MSDTFSPLPTLADPTMEGNETIPPAQTLRYIEPHDLYHEMPKIASLTKHKPEKHIDCFQYFSILTSSTTPEDAITFVSFALMPRMAIWWGYEAVRHVSQPMSEDDKRLMQQILKWTERPYDLLRWEIMSQALFASHRTPAVFLGLAVGWSGGKPTPNDPLPVPIWRTPQAVNSAVLAALAQSQGQQRHRQMARILDLVSPMMRTSEDE